VPAASVRAPASTTWGRARPLRASSTYRTVTTAPASRARRRRPLAGVGHDPVEHAVEGAVEDAGPPAGRGGARGARAAEAGGEPRPRGRGERDVRGGAGGDRDRRGERRQAERVEGGVAGAERARPGRDAVEREAPVAAHEHHPAAAVHPHRRAREGAAQEAVEHHALDPPRRILSPVRDVRGPGSRCGLRAGGPPVREAEGEQESGQEGAGAGVSRATRVWRGGHGARGPGGVPRRAYDTGVSGTRQRRRMRTPGVAS
jgi:hypothetical protein